MPFVSLWRIYGRALIRRQGGMYCFFCECQCKRTIERIPEQGTIDHLIPKSRGGKSNISNLVICCFACNQEKGDTPYIQFFRKKEVIRLNNRMKRMRTKT